MHTPIKKMDARTEEEFNNFLMKASEVESIVRRMNSTDKKEQEIADLEAKRFLGDDDPEIEEKMKNLNEDDLQVKCDRTVFNKKALHEKEVKDQGTMEKEAFMAEVSKDADRRYQDRMIRTEKMETLKKQATLAFRRGEYEKAASLYTRAIEHIRDSPLLYNNRALTYIKLKFYDKAIPDIELALRLNEDCLRSWLLLAKANYCLENFEEYHRAIKEAKERNPKQEDFINEVEKDIKTEFGD